MPALYAGRIVELLPHKCHLLRAVHNFAARPIELAGEPQHSRHKFGGTFHLFVADCGVLEEVGCEQRAQHCAHVVAAVEVGVRERLHGVRIARRRVGPRRHGRFVRHEEVIHMARYELRRCGLSADYLHNVFAVEVAGVAHECLFAVVVVVGTIVEVPRNPAVGPIGIALGAQHHILGVADSPTGEGARCFLDVGLAVAAHAHAEKLQQLAPVVFVDAALVIVIVVKPHNHSGIF